MTPPADARLRDEIWFLGIDSLLCELNAWVEWDENGKMDARVSAVRYALNELLEASSVLVEGDTVTVDTRQWPTRYDLAPAAVSSSQTWQPDWQGVTRLEIIDESGRVFTRWECSIRPLVQDHGQTLKILVEPAPPASEPDK